MSLFGDQSGVSFEPPPPRRRSGIRVVCLGGGTGLSMILRGLKHVASPTAVVTTTDDGGSSGRLRRDFGMPAPGDLRNCLAALAEDESLVGQLFQHRFTTGELAGHSFGNLFLAALTHITGNFLQAIRISGKVLAVRGTILPSTLGVVQLGAGMLGDVEATALRNAYMRMSLPTAGRIMRFLAVQQAAQKA